ncbi:flavodoxin family protein [Desulfonatronospira sp.]|uniref:flavodoxin family protein n=1 Tax=Desulfonatronospira sp. TaxID=1962951 RepID=UPI0025BDB43F|nr:flavodoxin family protein [Desulfonatronospira sp.]
MTDSRAMVLGCSPRKDGNSDRAVQEIVHALQEQGRPVESIYLRDKKILPCIGCRKCETSRNNRCILAGKDDVQEILDNMQACEHIFFSSPIYYYHVPAVFKSLIDRGQSVYEVWAARGEPKLDLKNASCVLIAGRKKGERLFEGSLLTLKYFLHPLGFALNDLCLRGIDLKEDLERDADSRKMIRDFAVGINF